MRKTAFLFVISLLVTHFAVAASEDLGSSIEPNQSQFVPASDPENREHWQIVTQLSDEFNRPKIDLDKWTTTHTDWKGRFPSWFTPGNVTQENGKLKIVMKQETVPGMKPGFRYTTGWLRSLHPFLYGYAEIRSRAMNSAGSSSFWLNNNQPDWWTEIDIFEIGGKAKGHEQLVHTNVHEFYNPSDVVKPWVDNPKTHRSDTKAWKAPWKPADGYHIYGVEWTPSTITWFVDGQPIRSVENSLWHQPLYINLDSETMPNWWGLPNDKDLPSTFSVDYVRVWEESKLTGGKTRH